MAFFRKKITKTKPSFLYIHEAVDAGDLNAVRQFLESGADVQELDSRGAPPLHVAAASGHLQIAQLLVESGADVNFLIEEGGTPLMSAASCLQPQIIEFLLFKGGQPNKKGADGRFPLAYAFQPPFLAVDKQLRCIQLLLAAGAEINDRTDFGSTPLMNAAWYGNKEAVEELLRNGADPLLEDNKGRTAAMLAFERGHDELAKLLKNHADLIQK